MSNPPTSMFSQQTGHKYTFQLELKKLFVTPSLPFQVKIVWARNQNRIQSQNPIKLQPPQNQVTLQQCFCNKSTVLFNPKKFQFRKKQSRIQIILYANGSPKQGGQFVLNLCEILDPYNIKKQQQKVYKVVTRQQKPRCEIQFKLTAEYCQQMIRDQQRQGGSVVGSISSKNTTSMNPGPSIISGLQSKQYVQKKNLFLYEAPSKDNQSVTSYNSYSTGMMRYNSGKKDREDSTRKEEYGLSTRRQVPTGTELFTKTASVNMKEFDTRSKGGYNRVTMQQNYDNRTQNYDPQTSKQLQDQQSKRSKLQAEVSRLNIYMKEQSSKLSEYIQENAKLKQQLNRMSSEHQNIRPALEKETGAIKLHYEEQLSKMRHDSDELHNRTFELNNENRELTRRYEQLIEEKQKTEEQLRKAMNDKQRAQTRFQSLNRNVQTLANHKQLSSRQVENLRDQLEHIKSLNVNLRESLEKQRRKLDQIQFANTYQKSALEQSTKKKQQRLYELQRQNSTLVTEIKDKQRQLQTKTQLLYRLERSSTQYKDKLVLGQSDKNRMLQQNGGLRLQIDRLRRDLSSVRQNVSKVRDQKTAQYEQKNTQLQTINYQHLQKIRALQHQIQQNLQKTRTTDYELQQTKKNNSQLLLVNDTIKKDLQDKKNQIHRLQTSIRGLKQLQTRFYIVQKLLTQKERTLTDKERLLTENERQLLLIKQQNNKAHYQISQLQDHKRKLQDEGRKLQDHGRKLLHQLQQAKRLSKNVPNVDVNQILRETVQMQVELKFKTDELLRLKHIEEKHEQALYQLQISSKNIKELQHQTQTLQKQVKDKNKLYLIQVEKGKLILKDKLQLQKATDELKCQLKKCQQIIFNGDMQVKDMEAHIHFLEHQNSTITHKIKLMETSIKQLQLQLNSTTELQAAMRQRETAITQKDAIITQLQRDCQQKTLTINTLTLNINNANKKIHELQTLTYTKQSEAKQALRTAHSSSQKLIELQSNQSTLATQLHKSLHQKKSLELKCDTMMQQLHSLKKQFEEEKVRSTSVVSIRSSEDQVKIRQLQNQLQKKDKTISKLTKQKLQIEQENINLHVQVMKKLSEMEKTKDLTSQ